MWKLMLICLLICGIGCGIAKSRYKKYDEDTVVAGLGESCPEALEAFKANIAPGTDGECQTCHAPGASAASYITFVKGDNKTSATNLKKNRFSLDVTKLWAFLSTAAAHPGASQAKAQLNESKINTWITAEKACPAT